MSCHYTNGKIILIIIRAIVGGPAGQAMAGLVLGLTKQYIGLEVDKIILQLMLQIY